MGKKVTKSTGASFLTTIYPGDAIKIDNEIRRVDYVTTANELYVTKLFTSSHATPIIYKDFVSNNAYVLQYDNFNNIVTSSSMIKTQTIIESCSVFSGLTSLLIYDYDANFENRRESLITGTYDNSINSNANVEDVFVFRANRQANYLLNIVEFTGNLDINNQATVTAKQAYTYAVWLNGKVIPSSEYSFDGNVITVTSTNLRGFNYVRVLHYPLQSLSGVTVKLRISSYDNVFNLANFAEFYKINLTDGFSSTINYEFYEKKQYDMKQNTKIKINSTNTISITCNLSTEADDALLVQKYIQYYLRDVNKFRLIKVLEDQVGVEYWHDARLLNGNSFNETKESNTVTYTIEFKTHTKYSDSTWGLKNWGTNLFGLDVEVVE